MSAPKKPIATTVNLDLVKVLLVDTNLGPHGYPDIERVERLAAAAEQYDIEVVVPEIVVWEWAEHVWGRIEPLKQMQSQANGTLRKAGLPAIRTKSSPAHVLTVAKSLTKRINEVPNASVIPARKKNAKRALRDQILQQGSGIVKDGVKTGAADSAWMRDALSYVDGDPAKLLFVSDNLSDITRVFELLKLKPPQAANWWNTLSQLGEFNPASVSHPSALSLQSYIRGVLPQYLYGGMHGDEPSDEIPLWQLTVEATALAGLPEGATVQATEVRALSQLVSMDSVAVSSMPKADEKVRARLHFIGDVAVQYYELDSDGAVESFEDFLDDVVISVDIQFTLVGDTWLYDTSYDVRALDMTRADFEESSDALGELMTILEPLIEDLPAGWPLDDEDPIESVTNGHKTEVLFEGDSGDNWTVRILTDDGEAAVSCEYDPSTYVWAGKDGFHIRPPYVLTSTVNGVSRSSIFSVLAWLLGTLYPEDAELPHIPFW
jgi:hypothetical protein